MQFKRTLVGAMGALIAACSFAVSPDGSNGYAVPDNSRSKAVPISNWSPAAFKSQQTQTTGERSKAATDLAAVFRPLTPCRLIDTRAGQISAVGNIGGTIIASPGTRRPVNLTGQCGIPNIGNVAGLSLSFAVFNSTPNNGGSLSFTAPGAPATGFNIVHSIGLQWNSTSAAVVTGGTGGDFDVVSSGSTVDLIVDVNGYYQELGDLDVGTQQLDITGTTTGDLFELSNSGASGSTLSTSATGTNGRALQIYAGRFSVGGANIVGGSGTVYVHEVTAASINATCPARTNLNHPMLNGNPNAVILVTPLNNTVGPNPNANVTAENVTVAGNACTALNNWRLFFNSGNATVGNRYAIMIINNN